MCEARGRLGTAARLMASPVGRRCALAHGLLTADYEIEAALILVLVRGNRVPFHSVLAGRKRVHRHLHFRPVADQARLVRTHNASRRVPYDGITA